MPSTPLPDAACRLIEYDINMRDLHFLGFDIFDALASASSSTGGKPRELKDTHTGGDAASYALDALPVNTVIFVLDDGHYVQPELAVKLLRAEVAAQWVPGSTPSALTPTPSVGTPQLTAMPTVAAGSFPLAAPSTSAMAKHDLRRGFDTINRLVQLTREISTAKAATQAKLSTIAGVTLAPTEAGLDDLDAQLLRRLRRVQKMREDLDASVAECEQREERVTTRRAALADRAAHLRKGLGFLHDCSSVLPAMETEVQLVREEVSLLKNLISAKQLALVAELRALYPISELEKNRRYSIRGLELPERDLHTFPEEQVSTALGYTCHLVALLSKYLQVPLRYFPQPLASRSCMRDEVLNHTAEYPLYFKGVDQDAFAKGVFMLQRDVRQLLISQGISATGPGGTENHMLANIARLFSILLDVPLPAPDPSVAQSGAAAPVYPGSRPSAAAPAPLLASPPMLAPHATA